METKKEIRLLPLRGEGEPLYAEYTVLSNTPPPHRGFRRLLHAVGVLLCTLSCLFFLSIVALIVLWAANSTDLSRTAIRLAQQSLPGQAWFSIEEKVPYTAPDFQIPHTVSQLPLQKAPETDDKTSTENSGSTEPESDPEYLPILQTDLSCQADIHTLFNETEYEPDTKALLVADLPFPDFSAWSAEYGTAEPYILILHTHATESFTEEGVDLYRKTDSFRSQDPEQNMIAVGEVMAQTFRAAGIPVLHCTEMFDSESYQDSYSRAAAAIRTYLQEHPSIQIVLDVHRDSVIRSDGTKMQPVTEIDGKEYAQFMIVAGTDFKGAEHPRWRDNLNFALKIQQNLTNRTASFARSINLRGAAFNQQYRIGSLLLEVGSCGNTLAQAKRAGVLAAIAISDVVTGGGCIVEVEDILG